MIEIKEKIDISPTFDLELISPKERLIFFDIETTGLKAGRSFLYMIGAVSCERGTWHLRQFFAEGCGEEAGVLSAFASFISEKKRGNDHLILVSFNGDGFDIPYIKEAQRQYGMPSLFKDTVSLDLYRAVKPFKNTVALKDCKLKTIEKLCGIVREDIYSGGELIYVYEEYLRLSGIPEGGCEDNGLNRALMEKCLSALLLHNAKDVKNLPMITDILGYKMLGDGEFELISAELLSVPAAGKSTVLDIKMRLHARLPREIYTESDTYVISVSGKDSTLFELAVRLFEGEARYYFQDYKNYYYLPAEDCAVHRSVGEFVDRKNRVRATARTCYIKKCGLFIPEPEPVFTPVYYRTYKGEKYALFDGEMLSDSEKIKRYAAAVLTCEVHKPGL